MDRKLFPVAVAAVLLLGGCSNEGKGTSPAPTPLAPTAPAPGQSGTAPTTAPVQATRDRSEAVNGFAYGAPIATATGVIETAGKKVPGTVEVLALATDDASTVMEIRVVPSQQITFTSGDQWSVVAGCTDRITLVDTKARKEYGTGVPAARTRRDDMPDCLTSKNPGGAGPYRPVYLFAYYAPLPADLTSVELRIPGFTPTPVPVTRA